MLYRQDANQDPVMILITDGRATSPLNKGTNPVTDALEEAKRIGRRNIPVAVIDTESGFIKLGLAKKLAKAMGASYFQVDKYPKTSFSTSGERRPICKEFPVPPYRDSLVGIQYMAAHLLSELYCPTVHTLPLRGVSHREACHWIFRSLV